MTTTVGMTATGDYTQWAECTTSSELSIQNRGSETVEIYIGATAPAAGDHGYLLSPGDSYELENSDGLVFGRAPFGSRRSKAVLVGSAVTFSPVPVMPVPGLSLVHVGYESAKVAVSALKHAQVILRLDGVKVADAEDGDIVRLDGLQQGESYQLDASQHLDGFASLYSTPLSITVTQVPVLSLTAKAITQDQIVVSFGNLEPDARVEGTINGLAFSTTNQAYAFDHLSPGTEYTIIAKQVEDDGQESAVSTQVFTTLGIALPTPDPLIITATGVTDSSISVSFGNKQSGALVSGTINGVPFSTSDVAYTFESLSAETAYTIQVVQIVDGQTSASNSVTVTTVAGAVAITDAVYTLSLASTNSTETSLDIVDNYGFTSYEYSLNGGTPQTMSGAIPMPTGDGYATRIRGVVDGVQANWSDPFVVVPPSLDERTYVSHLNALDQHYTINPTTLSGDFSIRVKALIGPGDCIVSGYTDAENYFRLLATSDGYLRYDHYVAGVATEITTGMVVSDRVVREIKVDRVGSELTLRAADSFSAYTVPSDDLVIDRVGIFNNGGTLSNPLSGTIAELVVKNAGATLIDVKPDSTDTVTNSGSAGDLTGVSFTSKSLASFSYDEENGEYIASEPSYSFSNVPWDLSTASTGDILYGTTYTSGTSGTEGAYQQRLDYTLSEPLNQAVRAIVGTSIRTLGEGVTEGSTVADALDNRRIYLQNNLSGTTGVVSSVTATPRFVEEDPRKLFTVIHVGDSITNYMLSENGYIYRSTATDVNGIRMEVVNEGIGGNTVQQMEARLPAILSSYADRENVLVLIMAGMNQDGNGYAAFETSLRNCVSLVQAAGFECGVMGRTSTVNEDIGDSDVGINTGYIYPVIQDLTPDWWDSSNNKPVLDMFPVLLGGQNETPNLYRDNLHPSDEGELVMIDYVAPIVARKLREIF